MIAERQKEKIKTIVFIDLFAGGHRTAFMRLFAQSCLSLNCNVICLYPDIDALKFSLSESGFVENSKLQLIRYEPKLSTYKNWGRFTDAVNTLSYWKSCGKLMREIEKENNLTIDLVFFNWLDSQMANYLPAFLVDMVFPYYWSGLYFHPKIFRIQPEFLLNKASFKDVDSVFLAKRCVAITVHDEGILEKYQQHLGKKILLFPEIADDTPPDENNLLAKKIKNLANGRIVVGLIGLEPYKGTLSMIRLAKQADASKYFFAFTGYFRDAYLNNLSPAEKDEFNDFRENLPENCIWQTGSLNEGAEYNAVFCSFDIIHIVYKDFYSSSNRLTKAAIFQRLVLANNYGCVGDDVPKYNLGETTSEDDTEEQYEKLNRLRERILSKNLPYEQWRLYAQKHSSDRLTEKFEEILNFV